MRYGLFLFLYLLTNLLLKAQDSPLKNYLDSASYYRLSGDTMEVFYLTKAISLQPQNPVLYELRAYAKSFIENLDPKKYGPSSAIKDLDIAIKLDPKKAVFYEQRGYLRMQTKNYYQAMKDLNKAIKLDKKKASAYRKRGDLFWNYKNYPRAGNDFYTAATLDTTSIYNLRKVADCFYELGNYRDAIKYYQQAISKSKSRSNFTTVYNEDYVLSLLYKANAVGGVRQVKQAIDEYSEVIEYNEKFEGLIEYTQEAYRFRGVAKLSADLKEGGCEDLKMAEKLGDKDASEYIDYYCK